jgi:hypothetical protein
MYLDAFFERISKRSWASVGVHSDDDYSL